MKLNGFDRLEETERKRIKELIDKRLKKFSQILEEPSKVKIQVQTYSSEGKNKKTSVHVELRIRKRKLEADAISWNSYEAVKDCFEKIFSQADKDIHLSDSHHAHRKKPSSLKKPKNFKDILRKAWS